MHSHSLRHTHANINTLSFSLSCASTVSVQHPSHFIQRHTGLFYQHCLVKVLSLSLFLNLNRLIQVWQRSVIGVWDATCTQWQRMNNNNSSKKRLCLTNSTFFSGAEVWEERKEEKTILSNNLGAKKCYRHTLTKKDPKIQVGDIFLPWSIL